jgi:hypothetical protein
VGGALLLRLGHLCVGMLRLTGGDISGLFAFEFSFTYPVLIYDYDTYRTLLVR